MEKTEKDKNLQKESGEILIETLMTLRRENEQLKKRVDELEKGLEEMLATANLIL